MKKLFIAFFVCTAITAGVMSAQAAEPWGYGIYTDSVSPADYSIPGAKKAPKIGRATCSSVLGIVNWGDCSVEKAMENGKISNVTYADWEKKWIVVYGTKTLRVHGN